MNLNKATASAVFILKKQSQWHGFLFWIKQDNNDSSIKILGISSSCSLVEFASFLLKWILNDVITEWSFGATANACIELRVKYFLPKPFSNFN